ncbi:DUF6389 family protein [Amycolatopsis circi]|uniref:DUF6389 family protein n=1 Tax=Amycolatopsis circi TaxID=871959 RepID=UPI0013BE8F0D|nr:DUF6389 family protein [Amycolatopsis circi]
MDTGDYRAAVTGILGSVSNETSARLERFWTAARADGVEGIVIDVFVDQDGWEPAVPPRPHGWTRDDLEAAFVDVVRQWVTPLLPGGAPKGFWRIGSLDGTFA